MRENKNNLYSPNACSGINVYKVNEDGKVCMKNKALVIQGAKRCISSLSFGHGFFWDCLVAGAEGPGKDSINGDHQQGQVSTNEEKAKGSDNVIWFALLPPILKNKPLIFH